MALVFGFLFLIVITIGLPAVLGGMIGAATASYGWAALSALLIQFALGLAIKGLKTE